MVSVIKPNMSATIAMNSTEFYRVNKSEYFQRMCSVIESKNYNKYFANTHVSFTLHYFPAPAADHKTQPRPENSQRLCPSPPASLPATPPCCPPESCFPKHEYQSLLLPAMAFNKLIGVANLGVAITGVDPDPDLDAPELLPLDVESVITGAGVSGIEIGGGNEVLGVRGWPNSKGVTGVCTIMALGGKLAGKGRLVVTPRPWEPWEPGPWAAGADAGSETRGEGCGEDDVEEALWCFSEDEVKAAASWARRDRHRRRKNQAAIARAITTAGTATATPMTTPRERPLPPLESEELGSRLDDEPRVAPVEIPPAARVPVAKMVWMVEVARMLPLPPAVA